MQELEEAVKEAVYKHQKEQDAIVRSIDGLEQAIETKYPLALYFYEEDYDPALCTIWERVNKTGVSFLEIVPRLLDGEGLERIAKILNKAPGELKLPFVVSVVRGEVEKVFKGASCVNDAKNFFEGNKESK